MFTPNFTDPQFLDANGPGGLNSAFGNVSGSIHTAVSGIVPVPGMLGAEYVSFAFNPSVGVTGTVTFAPQWGLIDGSGVFRKPHGVINGQDTQTYSVDFTPCLPSSAGTNTAYLLVSGVSIQQDLISIPGPPPGHPSWNPNFQATTGYTVNVDSIAVYPSLTPPDNQTTFGLLTTQLAYEQAGISSYSTGLWQRAGAIKNYPYISAPAGAMSAQQAQQLWVPAGPNQTTTLPSSSVSTGLIITLLNNNTTSWVIAASGTDVITAGSTVQYSSLTIPTSGACVLWTNGQGTWAELSATNLANIGGGPLLLNAVAAMQATSFQEYLENVPIGPSATGTNAINPSTPGTMSYSFVAPCDGAVLVNSASNLSQPASTLVTINTSISANGTQVGWSGSSTYLPSSNTAACDVSTGQTITVETVISVQSGSGTNTITNYKHAGVFAPSYTPGA